MHAKAIDIAPAHGSDNETSLDQPGSACSQEIHHHLHHHHHHHYNLNINAVKEQNVEEFLPDADNFASKLFKMYSYYVPRVIYFRSSISTCN